MSDYLLIYTAHIDETRRPKDQNFPKEIRVTKLVQGIQTQENLQTAFNGFFQQLIMQPGIVVFLDETEPIDSTLTFDKRVYVPWHLITHFHGDVKLVTPRPGMQNLLEGLVNPSTDVPEESKEKPN